MTATRGPIVGGATPTAEHATAPAAERPEGRHVAGLNYGDLFAYGLASLRAEPLLFVGDDLAKTDVTPAAQPPT